MKRTVALALCLASQADAFAPSSLGSISGVRPSRAVDSSVSLRMKVDGERQDRRSMLLRGAALALLPVSGAMPAAAQFGDIALPNLLGDPRGERPAGLGPVAVKRDEDGMVIRGFLSPCDSDNCVSTSDDVYSKRYLPPWTYNQEGTIDKDAETAMQELVAVVKNYKGAKIIKQDDAYLLAEFERELGFVDDVEFLIKTDPASGAGTVEYRSGARKTKKSDHRSRIRALRVELQKKGWKSVGYRCKSYTYSATGDPLCSRKEEKAKVAFPDGRISAGDVDEGEESVREERYEQRLLAPQSR